ncbi:unnamed protein product, partial [Staurois parvus]
RATGGQPTPRQGSWGLNRILAVESGLAQLPPSFLGTLGSRGLNREAMAQALRGITGQFITQVVCAHNRASSGHGWSVHTAATVQDTGGRCTQQGQFRTRVVGAHSRASSKHGWSVHTAGTVQNTGDRCTQQGQFRTWVVCAHNRDNSGHG